MRNEAYNEQFRTDIAENEAQTERLGTALAKADAIVIGAGAGLSASAGFTYTGERFERYFADFIRKYGFADMYSGGFYPFPSLEEHWAYWSRYIYINRYMDAPRPVYDKLLELVRDKDYFVLTTNVDHCFQKAGFDKDRLFYTQGDYGLFQCSRPCHAKTCDNREAVMKMLISQGYEFTDRDAHNTDMICRSPRMQIASELVPHCPVCGRPMTMNLRCDDSFVEDEGWNKAADRYDSFIHAHAGQCILFLELGVGFNTPGIIKYPFWRMTAANSRASYACISHSDAYAPAEIRDRAICINADIGAVLNELKIYK